MSTPQRSSGSAASRQPTSSFNPPQLQESNFWTTGKGVLTIVGIAVAATLVVMGFIFSTLSTDHEFGQPATYSDQPTDSVCGLGGVALEGSIADTPEAQWVQHRGVWLPTNATYGPGLLDSQQQFECFEHSPRGMLFAASAYAGQLANPQYWQDGVPDVFSGAHAAAHLVEAQELFTTVFLQADSALGGFRLVSYDGTTAQIEMAVTSFDGAETSRTALLMNMVWQDGDWYLDAGQDQLGVSLNPLSDLIGFQAWQA